MKRSGIVLLIIVIIGIGIGVGIFLYNINTKNELKEYIIENQINDVSMKVDDECTEEWRELDQLAILNSLETNSNEEKLSPNCLINLRNYYKTCQHTTNEYIDIPQNLVNKSKKDLENEYPDYEIKKYTSTEVILYKECEGECGQHFVLRNNNGKITVYKINENNDEEVYERTEISIDYLTENDKEEIENGIRVNGKEDLNQLIEDFE